MTLKEKYYKELDWYLSGTCERKIKVSEDLEKIADNYAIEFLEFIEGAYSFGNVFGKWYLHANTSKEYTSKELLEIFKKEKGL